MSKAPPLPLTDAIETAVQRHAAAHPREGATQDVADQALALRLRQLRAAMGDAPEQAAVQTPPAHLSAGMTGSERLRLGARAAWAPKLTVAGFVAMAGAMGFLIARALPSHTPEAATHAAAAEAGRRLVSFPTPVAIVPNSKTNAESDRAKDTGSGRPGTLSIGDENRIRELLENWRQAWSDRDIEAYLGFYSPAFVPANGQPRAEWAAARRSNISGRTDIGVQVRDLHIRPLNDQRVELAFLQDYASGNYREIARPKTLLLAREEGQWRIVREVQRARATGSIRQP